MYIYQKFFASDATEWKNVNFTGTKSPGFQNIFLIEISGQYTIYLYKHFSVSGQLAAV